MSEHDTSDGFNKWIWHAVYLGLLAGFFLIFIHDSDMLNRRIAVLECRAGDMEKCGPPWNLSGK